MKHVTLWRDVPVLIKRKETISTKTGLQRKFVVGYGDVPGVSYNSITDRFEEVVNTRGVAYATRNRLSFRK